MLQKKNMLQNVHTCFKVRELKEVTLTCSQKETKIGEKSEKINTLTAAFIYFCIFGFKKKNA